MNDQNGGHVKVKSNEVTFTRTDTCAKTGTEWVRDDKEEIPTI